MSDIVDRNINCKSEILAPKMNPFQDESGVRTSFDNRKADEHI